MEYIVKFSDAIMYGLQKEISILGFTFTWWQVLMFEIVSSVIIYLIVGFIFDD